jgi:hypothetical protein
MKKLSTQQKTMNPNPNKTKTVRELGQVDINGLKEQTARLSEKVWTNETRNRENEFEGFHHTQHIIFRFPDHKGRRTVVHNNPIWHVWKPILMPVIEQATAPYGYANGQVKAVMLARLKAGHIIDLHTDGSMEYYYLHKIHIPLQTNDQVGFHIKPHTYHFKEGYAYEVNNIAYHSVFNKGSEDRIHLIFEYVDVVQ